jgi:multiple sugar transport system permease protein
MALPFIIIITSSVFVSVPRELEEAAMTLGCTRLQAFRRVALPLALPGLAAAAIFTFVISWNEVLAATILTMRNRTLPAQVMSALNDSPLYFKYAGGLFMILPALIFIFFARRYLLNLWGPTGK